MTVEGIDVSSHQFSIDWNLVAQQKQFAIIRASYGTTIDLKFKTSWAAAERAGIIRGAYQFFRPTQSAVAQANFLCDLLGGHHTNGDIFPVIDVEKDGTLTPVAAPASAIQAWIDVIKNRLGVTPIIYTGISYWNDNYGTQTFGCPLWISNPRTPPVTPGLPLAWANWVLWQYSWTGRVNGIKAGNGLPGDVDLDRYPGTIEEFKNWLAPVEVPPPVVPAHIIEARNRIYLLKNKFSEFQTELAHIEQLLNTE